VGVLFVVVALAGACAGPAAPTNGTAPTPTGATPATPAAAAPDAAATPSATQRSPWAQDLRTLDQGVRTLHPGPFVISPEAAWKAKLAELEGSLPDATPDQQLVQLASLVGLLDTHSGLTAPQPLHAYELLFYPFSDGWFVIRAKDPTLVGSRLVSIGGTPVAKVEAALRPLVPSDNESGELDAMQGLMSYVEYLHGAGIVTDRVKPAYVLERPDRTRLTVDPASVEESTWVDELGVIGDLVGAAPEAVARRGEPIWTRLDTATRTFVISFNDYGTTGVPEAVTAMKAALVKGTARRVVFDMRYLRGGDASGSDMLIEAFAGDPRVNRPGGLTILIGRENVSAGTVVARELDKQTKGVFVGEPTPARADNFLCSCADIKLPNSKFVVTVPTFSFHTGDPRPAIAPDVPMALTSGDFFAGRDPVLAAALKGIRNPNGQ
jgi:hypothetical protein